MFEKPFAKKEYLHYIKGNDDLSVIHNELSTNDLHLLLSWLPNYIRSGSHAIVLFVVYEKARVFFGLSNMS